MTTKQTPGCAPACMQLSRSAAIYLAIIVCYFHTRVLELVYCRAEFLFLRFFRDVVEQNFNQLQYKNPDVQILCVKDLMPTPFITFFLGAFCCLGAW